MGSDMAHDDSFICQWEGTTPLSSTGITGSSGNRAGNGERGSENTAACLTGESFVPLLAARREEKCEPLQTTDVTSVHLTLANVYSHSPIVAQKTCEPIRARHRRAELCQKQRKASPFFFVDVIKPTPVSSSQDELRGEQQLPTGGHPRSPGAPQQASGAPRFVSCRCRILSGQGFPVAVVTLEELDVGLGKYSLARRPKRGPLFNPLSDLWTWRHGVCTTVCTLPEGWGGG
ncbi:unnamed protein product [Boreogadus saida]